MKTHLSVSIEDEWTFLGAPGQLRAAVGRWRVVRFGTVFEPNGFAPRVELHNLETADVLIVDPSEMTVAKGWKLEARKGVVLQ